MSISANTFELEKSGFKRVRRDIEVSPEGLMTVNIPYKGIVAFGISWWQGLKSGWRHSAHSAHGWLKQLSYNRWSCSRQWRDDK